MEKLDLDDAKFAARQLASDIRRFLRRSDKLLPGDLYDKLMASELRLDEFANDIEY